MTVPELNRRRDLGLHGNVGSMEPEFGRPAGEQPIGRHFQELESPIGGHRGRNRGGFG